MDLRIDPETLHDDLPTHITDVIEGNLFLIYAPDDQEDDQAYQHAIRGRCMTCHEPMAESTVLLVNENGIVGMWCSGGCLADMHSISFLQNVMDGIIDRIEGNEADEVPNED